MASAKVHGKTVSYKCPRGPDHEGRCYEPYPGNIPGTGIGNAFKNKTDDFMVMISFDSNTVVSAAGTMTSFDSDNNVVDSWLADQSTGFAGSPTPTQVAASYNTVQDYMVFGKKMLVPPGGRLQTSGAGCHVFCVVCATFEDACAIL